MAGPVKVRGRRFNATSGRTAASAPKRKGSLTGLDLVSSLESVAKGLYPAARQAFIDAVGATLHSSTIAPILSDIRIGVIPNIDSTTAAALGNITMQASTLREITINAFHAGGADTAARMRGIVNAQYDASHPYAVHNAAQGAGDNIAGINSNTRAAVQQMVTNAVQSGVRASALADQLVNAVGLLPQQVKALDSFRAGLVTAGKPQGVVDQLVNDYSNRLLGDRANMIARTEINKAVNGGRRAYYGQLMEKGIINDTEWEAIWILGAGGKTGHCVDCRDQAFRSQRPSKWWNTSYGPTPGPPIHPSCGCQVIVVPKGSGIVKAAITTLQKDNPYERQKHGNFGFGPGKAPGGGDARVGAGQRQLNLVHPLTGQTLNRNEVTDSFERLLFTQAGARLQGVFGKGIEHTAETRAADFPVDGVVGKYALEVKTVSARSADPKATMKVTEILDKEQTASVLKKIPATVVQVVNDKTKSIDVFVWRGEYASKRPHQMEHVFTYKYSQSSFKAAYTQQAHFRSQSSINPANRKMQEKFRVDRKLAARDPRAQAKAKPKTTTKTRATRATVKKADAEYAADEPINAAEDVPKHGDLVMQVFNHEYRRATAYIWVEGGPDLPAGTNRPITWMTVGHEDVNGYNPQTGLDSHGKKATDQ